MQSSTRRSPRTDSFTVACVIAYGLLGWTLSGLGAVLPDLRDAVGGVASAYPSLPGAALILIGLAVLRRPHTAGPDEHRASVRRSGAVLAVALVLLVTTGASVVSVVGAAVVALMAAVLIRLLPAALTERHPETSAAVMTTANAWSSLAGIAAPLAVGATTAIGLGWRAGFVVPPAIAALVVAVLTSRRASRSSAADSETGELGRMVPPSTDDPEVGHSGHGHSGHSGHARQPWFDAWLLLTLSILVEFSFAFYAATYLREEVEMSSAGAAAGAASFAIGMASGRFLAGPFRQIADRAMSAHLVTIAAGFVLMWFLPHPVTAIAGIAVAGFGIALLYPIGIDRLMRRFPHSAGVGASRGALASGTALLTAPALLGIIRAVSDVRVAYLAVPVLLAAIAATHRWSITVAV